MRFVRSLLLAAVGMLCLSDMGVLVSGANPTGVITRQPLDVFLANKKQADLFYLALARMQNNALVPYTNPQSWYALAAVHGTPIKYDDVTPTNPGTTYGYCNHGDEIFPTWHRPYLSALENSLIANARAIIDALPVDKRLDGYTVADSLRLPYWNWDKIATRSTTLTLPGSASATTQTITNWLATGTSQSIPNPLLSYTIPAGPTVPTSLAGSSATPKKTGRSFTTGFRAVSLTDQINKLLSITSWKSISTHDSTTANIESVHDTLHGLVGGSMGIVGTAAYDPIFWLHHNNVDRILALYQASQPSSWVTSTGKVTRNTLMAKPGAATNATSPLWPFQWKHYSNVMVPTTQTQSTFIVSNDIKDTTKWGYSYPELDYLAKKGLTKGTTAYRAELLKFFPRDSTTFVPQATVPPARRLLQAGAQRPDEIQWTVDFETFPRDYFGGSVNVRVFVNLPTATAATSTEDAHTAAILSTFNMRGEYSATQTIGLSASITSAVSDLGILSYATGEPRVDFQHIRVVITGPAVESWLQTATPQQLAQLKQDLSSDLFTPKIKEFALYVQEDGSAKNVAKRYIGVPVTITVANDGDVNGVVSGSVQTLSVELNGDELITPTTISGEASSTNNLPIIIGAAAGGAVILLVIATAIVITRRRSAHKSTVQTVQFEMTPNPAVSIDMQTSHV